MKKRWIQIPVICGLVLTLLLAAAAAADVVVGPSIGGIVDSGGSLVGGQGTTIDAGTCGDNLNWKITDQGVLTISGSGPMTEYASANDAPWFSYNSGTYAIKEVLIWEGPTTIAPCAFHWCKSLTTVRLPSTLEVIGHRAFYECTALEYVSLPDTLLDVGECAFYGCTSMTDLHIPGSLQIIQPRAFSKCSGLETLTIGEGVQTISYYGISDCPMVTCLKIPASVTEIHANALANCTGLTHLLYGGESGTWQTVGAESSLPDGVVVLEYNPNLDVRIVSDGIAASGNTELTFVADASEVYYTLDGSEPDLSSNRFNGPVELESDSAFTVSAMGVDQSSHWFGPVRTAYVSTASGVIDYGICGDGVNWELGYDGVLRVSGQGAMYNYAWNAEKPWSMYLNDIREVIIEDGVTHIGNYAFEACSLTRLEMADSVLTVGDEAFYKCEGLKEIVFSQNLTHIGYESFSYCHGLTSVVIPGSVETIDGLAFCTCYGLQEVIIGQGVQTIGICAFSCCHALTDILIPDSVTTISEASFENTGLTEITIPGSVASISELLFYDCEKLERVELEEGVSAIAQGAFVRCSKLKEVVMPESLRTIGYRAFGNCTALTEVAIPSGTTTLENNLFSCCSSLLSVELPVSLESLGNNLFEKCPNMADIYFPEGDYSDWRLLSSNSNIPEDIRVFTMESYLPVMPVEVVQEEVPGGILVELYYDEELVNYKEMEIRYTMDGSVPCSQSTLYEGPFLLDTAGEYYLGSRCFGPDGSDACVTDYDMSYVTLEQSAPPQIVEEEEQVTLLADGDIYYTLDVAEEPTTEHFRYTQPLQFSRTTAFKARVIDPGYTPSETVSYTFYAHEGGTLDFPDDTYSFGNVRKSFGYSMAYKIPEDRYTEIFGSAMGKMLYGIFGGSAWGGSCFGMTATALMFHEGVLDLENYSDQAQTIYELLAPASRESTLTKLIERYQVAQFLPTVMAERNDASEGGSMVISGLSGNTAEGKALVDAVQQACNQGDPVILIVWNATGGCHAVVPYQMEPDKIWVYDCDMPGAEKYIQYSMNEDGTYRFSYGRYQYAIAFNRLSTLLEGLENLQSGDAILSAGESDQMLLSSSSADITLRDSQGSLVKNYLSYRATEDMQTESLVACLDTAVYTVHNNALEGPWTISAATDTEYCSVTVADPAAVVEIGEKDGHLFIVVEASDDTEMDFCTGNSGGAENRMSMCANRAEVQCSKGNTTLVESSASSLTMNGVSSSLVSVSGVYAGAVAQPLFGAARDPYVESKYTLRTDITELPESTFVLSAFVSGVSDQGMVYAASYDADGRMTGVRSVPTQIGKTKYVFTIEEGAAEVRVFLVNQNGSVPLTSDVLVR